MPTTPDPADPKHTVTPFQFHPTRSRSSRRTASRYMFIQACIAILILVGFESVTSMGEEAKNAKRDIPRAVLLSLLIQGVFCYLIEYFAANYFLNNGYKISNALGSAAPLGDMMVIVGTWLFGSSGGRRLHARPGAHRVPGAHRHDALLHEHRRARHLRDGQGRGSPRALRHAARQEADAAPRDLDARDDLGGHRHRLDHLQLLRTSRARRRCDQRLPTTSGTASGSSATTRPPSFRRACWSSRWSATSARSCST